MVYTMGCESRVREEKQDISKKDEQGWWGVSMARKWRRRTKQLLREMTKHFIKQEAPKNPQHLDSQRVLEDEDHQRHPNQPVQDLTHTISLQTTPHGTVHHQESVKRQPQQEDRNFIVQETIATQIQQSDSIDHNQQQLTIYNPWPYVSESQ